MKKVLGFAVIAATLLASCSNEDEPAGSLANGELGVSATVTGSVSTRALVTGFNAGDQIAVFITGTGYTPQVAAYTYVDGTTQWTSPADAADKIFLSNETATVYGYYPSDATLNPGPSSGSPENNDLNNIETTFTYPENSFNAAGQTDYLYATAAISGAAYPIATATNSLPSVDLYLHHAASKLSFVINKAESYSGTGTLSSIKLSKTGGFYAGAGAMMVKDGLFSMGPIDEISFTGTATINEYDAVASTIVTAFGLAVPIVAVDATAGITLEIIVDGKAMAVALPADAPANVWEPGKNYTYTVTVKGTELIVNTVSVVDWIDVIGGNAEVN